MDKKNLLDEAKRVVYLTPILSFGVTGVILALSKNDMPAKKMVNTMLLITGVGTLIGASYFIGVQRGISAK